MTNWYIKVFIIILFMGSIFSNARIAFSRPGSIMRTPGGTNYEAHNQYIIGFGAEVTHFSDLNYGSATFFKAIVFDGYNFGLSYNTAPSHQLSEVESSTLSYLSFHLHKQIFKRNNIGVHFGVHDILYDSDTPHRISLFSLFTHKHTINRQYQLESSFGFGTGYISYDSHNYTTSNLNSSNEFFLGMTLYTPWLINKGGMKLLLEYDGWGLNLGVSIPATPAWTVNLGITHFENIQNFDDWDSDSVIFDDAPALAISFQMNIPKLKYSKIETPIEGLSNIYNQVPYDEAIDSMVSQATKLIRSLEDSLNIKQQEHNSLLGMNQSLNLHISQLQDSINHVLLDSKISTANLNKAMKHLSRSLEAYYAKNFTVALEETENAIKAFPGLAIAYARKGSIYFHLGDIKRATINWNIALRLDPEYDEVRAALLNLNSNETPVLPE